MYNLRKMMMNNWVSSGPQCWLWWSPLPQPRADGRKATNVTPCSSGNGAREQSAAARVSVSAVLLTWPEEGRAGPTPSRAFLGGCAGSRSRPQPEGRGALARTTLHFLNQ